ncbi:alpha-mannosidase [Geobacillus thermodenitrificans]|uniref:alpha-mannosidase n=1 Tax=Geobacillus thermodenitrificans TaxID=33940 RepID=UPI002E1F25C0|nr:alpha-mannosidase [Geobacillus thermodenitrificans]
MFLTEEKLEARIHELSEHRYREAILIPKFRFLADEKGEVGARLPETKEWGEITLGDYWRGRDVYAWLQADIDIPKQWMGKEIVGLFDFGKTGGGNNSGFESLLYLNGVPYQGVDSNHMEVFFPKDAAGSKLSLTFRLWSGLEGGGIPRAQEHKIKRAEVAWLDEVIDDLFFTGKAILQTVKILDRHSPERQLLLSLLDRAFRQIDWSKPKSDSFYHSVAIALQILKDELKKMEKKHPVTVRCVGHTHIDVAWLWRLKHTREKAARSFSTVLRLMEKYPEYIFLQSQPQLYEYIKSDYPEIFEQIRKRVAEGRWEAGGAMWLEADCNIPSGESLVRQLLTGTRFLRKEFGVDCKYLWLPDVFGYNWALPQILKKSGIHTFMTTKISWNQYNRMPHDTFWWRGIDGSEVLTHFITTPEPNKDWWFYTYNGVITPETVQGIWNSYRDKAINQELLLSYGYGDGGGGVNREMLEMRRRLNDIPGLPNVETGRADEFFERLHKKIKETDQYVHVWDGELYLEYHRGTYTSQAYNKRMNRKMELLYRETEWMGIVSTMLNDDWSHYPFEQLNEGWKIILRNQFHDIIPGSSIREVYEDSKEEYETAEKYALSAWENLSKSIIIQQEESTVTVFNSSPWARTDFIRVPVTAETKKGIWKDGSGKELKAERVGDHWVVLVEDVPSLGFSTIRFYGEESGNTLAQTDLFHIGSSEMTSPHYKIKWNDKGQITSIYDFEAKREVLDDGKCGNVLQVFEDKPLRFDAWDIDIFYQEKKREVEDLRRVSVKEITPLYAIVHFEWGYMDSSIKQDMIVYAHSRRIDFKTEVDWKEQNQLLKVAFPVKIRSTLATYDIQFGNVKRPTHWNTSWDYAKFETVAHQWADLSETGYGVSLLNDCKYGYDIKDNVMRLSLIKSATYPDYKQDQGHHIFTYSLLPHVGDWVEGQTVKEAWYLNNPLTYRIGQPVKETFSLFRVDANNIMIDAVKKAEDTNQIVLRLHEFTGRRGKVCITSDLSITAWQECDLMERGIGGKKTDAKLEFDINPYEIKTFLIDLK